MQTNTMVYGTVDEVAEALAAKLGAMEGNRQTELQSGVLNRLSLVTIDQVAELAKVSVTTARKWAIAGYFSTQETKRKERFPLGEVLQYIAGREDRLTKFPK